MGSLGYFPAMDVVRQALPMILAFLKMALAYLHTTYFSSRHRRSQDIDDHHLCTVRIAFRRLLVSAGTLDR